MLSKFDNAIAFQANALGLRAYRQQVLAENIANADTPNYKARDIDFKSALDAAMKGRSEGGLALASTASGHLPGALGVPRASLMYRIPAQNSADGNTVEMDIERGQFAENSVRYEAGLNFISGRIRTLLSAIQGQ